MAKMCRVTRSLWLTLFVLSVVACGTPEVPQQGGGSSVPRLFRSRAHLLRMLHRKERPLGRPHSREQLLLLLPSKDSRGG